jgi:hypothetical protein
VFRPGPAVIGGQPLFTSRDIRQLLGCLYGRGVKGSDDFGSSYQLRATDARFGEDLTHTFSYFRDTLTFGNPFAYGSLNVIVSGVGYSTTELVGSLGQNLNDVGCGRLGVYGAIGI